MIKCILQLFIGVKKSGNFTTEKVEMNDLNFTVFEMF